MHADAPQDTGLVCRPVLQQLGLLKGPGFTVQAFSVKSAISAILDSLHPARTEDVVALGAHDDDILQAYHRG